MPAGTQVVGQYDIHGREYVDGCWKPVTYTAKIERSEQQTNRQTNKQTNRQQRARSAGRPREGFNWRESGVTKKQYTEHQLQTTGGKPLSTHKRAARTDWFLDRPQTAPHQRCKKTPQRGQNTSQITQRRQNVTSDNELALVAVGQTLLQRHVGRPPAPRVAPDSVLTGEACRGPEVPRPPRQKRCYRAVNITHSCDNLVDAIKERGALNFQRSRTTIDMAPKTPEKKLQDLIHQNWGKIKLRCQKVDSQKTGTIFVKDFIEACSGMQPSLTEEEWTMILPAFGLPDDGRMAYMTFLRNTVLALNNVYENRAPDERRLLHAPKVKAKPLKVGPGIKSEEFMDVMMRMRPWVMANWKDLRRTFRSLDPRALGVVNPVQFRSVLQRHGMPISEDEFYHLLSYYDKPLKGTIPYNDFIGAFLRSV